MQKRILVPNGSYTEIRLIEAYKKMGLYVITSGNAPDLEGHKYADEYVCHDYSDYEGMLEIAKKLNIDYVSTCANDFGVITAAYIAEKLGLPGHDNFETARIIAEKDRFKKFAQKNGLLVIPSVGFYDVDSAIEYVETTEYPIIVKPTDLTGGKGVSRADTFEEARLAIFNAFERSKSKNIVIEPFIEGSQHSFCAFVVGGKVATYSSYNEYGSPNDPYLVGYTTSPAKELPEIARIMMEQIEIISDLLKLNDGIFHIQYRMHNGKPLIMECMRRCLGNHALLSASIQTEFSWEEWQAKAHCGMDCSDIPPTNSVPKYISEYYIQTERNGVVKDVVIDSELKKYIHTFIEQWYPGAVIDNYCVDKLGFLFFQFPSEKIQDEFCEKFTELIRVEME